MVQIKVPKRKLAAFCKRNQILKLALFGSVVRDDFTPQSDVDVLVEFDPEAHIGFFKLYDIEQELSALFHGRPMDIVTYRALNHRLRDRVLAESVIQFDERGSDTG
jgi:uncharacterized protein